MTATARNGQLFLIRKLEPEDARALSQMLTRLSDATRHRFSPHGFDEAAIRAFYAPPTRQVGYGAFAQSTGEMIAYSLFKMGFLEHDRFRFESYGLELSDATDCTYAPVVADAWQGQGVGNQVFRHLLGEWKQLHLHRILLWGGVQASNEQALAFYKRNGFRTLGAFEYHGLNLDMCLDIPY